MVCGIVHTENSRPQIMIKWSAFPWLVVSLIVIVTPGVYGAMSVPLSLQSSGKYKPAQLASSYVHRDSWVFLE